MLHTKRSDKGSPDEQRLPAIAVSKDACRQVHHQAGHGVDRDCCPHRCRAHSKALHGAAEQLNSFTQESAASLPLCI